MSLKRLHRIAATGALLAGALAPSVGGASSHREAPLISEDPSADNTDLWAFTSPDRPDTVTILAAYIGLEEPGGGPNWLRFSENVLYSVHIDNNGDARPDITYQFRFDTAYNQGLARGAGGTFFYNVGQIDGLPTAGNFHNALVAQRMEVARLDASGRRTVVLPSAPVAPTYVGRFAYGGNTPAMADANYTRIADSAITDLPGGGRVFAGPVDDAFFVDLGAVFDDVTFRDPDLTMAPPRLGNRGGGYDYVGGYNVHVIALQLPVTSLVRAGTPADPSNAGNVIGVYASASRPTVTIRRNCYDLARVIGRPIPSQCQETGYGQFVQVSRLGIPLVNEVLIPLELKDVWNTARPTDDAGPLFGPHILVPSLPTYAQVLYGPTGLRARAGYMAPTRSATDPANDMLTLVKGAPGLIAGVPTAGLTPADLLRLNVRTPATPLPTNVGNPTLATGRSRLGAAGGDTQGFPNGRRLFDDVVDIEERYVLNGLAHINDIPFGDGVDGNDRAYRATFPYMAIPWPGDDRLVHRQEPSRSTP